MRKKLFNLLNNSSSRYFNFPVSAIIVTKDGNEFSGVNVETSSPAAGICAERNALFNLITNGVNPKDIKEIHVMSKAGVFPCFICRQALIDYCDMDTIIMVYDESGLKEKVLLKELCNKAFSDEDLK